MDEEKHHIDLKDHSTSTVTVDNNHYIVAASGKFNILLFIINTI